MHISNDIFGIYTCMYIITEDKIIHIAPDHVDKYIIYCMCITDHAYKHVHCILEVP